jgi:type II secretory pathway component PulF
MLLWVVRGTDDSGHDLTAVIEAATRAEAEYMALRRGLPVVIVSEATSRDVAAARANRMLWKYTQDSRYRAFGRTVGALQLACLVLSGILTAFLVLKSANVNVKLPFLKQAHAATVLLPDGMA